MSTAYLLRTVRLANSFQQTQGIVYAVPRNERVRLDNERHGAQRKHRIAAEEQRVGSDDGRRSSPGI